MLTVHVKWTNQNIEQMNVAEAPRWARENVCEWASIVFSPVFDWLKKGGQSSSKKQM